MLKNKLKIMNTTVNELTDLPNNSTIGEVVDYLESEFPDSNFYFDVNIEPLIETLHDAGFTDDEIIKMDSLHYGRIVNFYYVKTLNMYMMEYGTY